MTPGLKRILVLWIVSAVIIAAAAVDAKVNRNEEVQTASSSDAAAEGTDETGTDTNTDVDADSASLNSTEETADTAGSETETQEDVGEESDTGEDSEYILPDVDTKYYSKSDLEGLSKEELRLARNEIYARHGRSFDDEELQAYFNSKSWYEALYTPEEFDKMGDSVFNEYEIYNRDLIVEVESER